MVQNLVAMYKKPMKKNNNSFMTIQLLGIYDCIRNSEYIVCIYVLLTGSCGLWMLSGKGEISDRHFFGLVAAVVSGMHADSIVKFLTI